MRRYIPLLLALLLAAGTFGCDNLGDYDDCYSCDDDYYYDDYGYNPLQAVDDFYQTTADTTIFVNDDDGVLINDFYYSASIDFPEVSDRGGQVLGNQDGSFAYTPPAGFAGTDSFVYFLSDGYEESSAVVTITVNSTGTPSPGFIVDSASGNDTSGNATTGTPFATLGGALSQAGVNAVIVIRPGNGQPYTGNLTLLDGQQLIGQGFQNVSPQAGVRPVISGSLDLGNNNVIRGLSFQNVNGDAVNGDDSRGATISNCVFNISSNGGRAVSGERASGAWVIAANTISRMDDAGIRLTSSGSGTLTANIDDNTITNCRLSAISLLSENTSSFTASVTDNVMAGNQSGFTFDVLAVDNSSFRLKLARNSNDDVYLLSTLRFQGSFGVENLATLSQVNSSGTVTLDQAPGSAPITSLAEGTIRL